MHDVGHRHRQRDRCGVAIFVGNAHGDLMDVILIRVGGRLKVLRRQDQYAGVGINGELRGVVTLKRPCHAAVGSACPSGDG